MSIQKEMCTAVRFLMDSSIIYFQEIDALEKCNYHRMVSKVLDILKIVNFSSLNIIEVLCALIGRQEELIQG